MLLSWQNLVQKIVEDSLPAFLNFLWSLILAIAVFVIGWLIAIVVGKLIAEILTRIKFNKLFESTGWKDALEKAELKVNPSEFIGAIFKWVLVIVALFFAVDVLGPRFEQFAGFLRDVIVWLPNLIVATAIFVVAIIAADILEKIVRAWVKKIEVGYAEFLGAVVKWAIYVFAALAILDQLEVSPTIVNALVIGFVGMISLAFGLAFGLGGKDAAAKIIENVKKRVSEK